MLQLFVRLLVKMGIVWVETLWAVICQMRIDQVGINWARIVPLLNILVYRINCIRPKRYNHRLFSHKLFYTYTNYQNNLFSRTQNKFRKTLLSFLSKANLTLISFCKINNCRYNMKYEYMRTIMKNLVGKVDAIAKFSIDLYGPLTYHHFPFLAVNCLFQFIIH